MKYLDICSALYDYTAQNEEEISFKSQDVLYILEKEDPDWHKAQLKVPNIDGPIGLIPANYIEKIKSIASIKAIYDYQSRSAEELSFKEDELLTLYENDDPDWFVAENSKGVIGIVPSNYVEEIVSETVVAETTEKQTTPAEPKWAIALYGFEPESKEETYLQEHEQVLVIDYENKDWWKIEHKDGKSGIVPANYIKFQDEYEQQLKIEQQEQREKDLLERKLAREQEEKEKERQLEVERRRKMQEDAKQKEVEAKRQASFAASNSASPQLGSPRRSQIPAPPPPTAVKSLPEHHDPNKPDPSRVRMWTDRTGAFKVEAQFLSCANGKIRLFKTNGVKIDVPTQKMCMEDLKYIESETGQKLIEDKSDNIPLGQLNVRFSWLEYFRKTNLPRDAAQRYAASFESNRLTERDLDRLTHHRMKSMGMSERHVRRIQRFIETNRAEPASEDEGPKPKVKKSVTFGAVSYIEEDGDDQEYQEGGVEWQIEQDARLARQLQEQDQGHSGLQRRGTGRPTPTQSAPRGVNSAVLTPQQFNSEPLKPTPVINTPNIPSPVKNNVPVPPPKFEDDAWAPRSSPSVTPSAPPQAWNQPTAVSSIPPQMPPRQRPTPQTSQQSLVDPQLLAKWGGSPALAAANTRPVPPPPAPFVVSPNHQSLNSLSAQKPMFYQQQQQVAGSGSFNMGQVQQQGSFASTQSPMQQQGSFTSAQSPIQQQQSSFASTQSPMQQQQVTMNQTQQVPGSFVAAHPMQHQVPATLSHANSFTAMQTGQSQFGAPQQSASFSSLPTNFQTPTFNQANQFQAQSTGYTPYSNQSFMGSTSSLQPQLTGASSIQSQSTGASWASATPANPFGGVPSYQASGHQAQYNTDPNDKYSVFKTVDTTTPSVFNNSNKFY